MKTHKISPGEWFFYLGAVFLFIVSNSTTPSTPEKTTALLLCIGAIVTGIIIIIKNKSWKK